jgi:putative addiction module antidote
MVELKVRKFGNSLGVVLPKEVINRLHTNDGERLFLIEAPDGAYQLTPYDPAFEAKMAKAGDIIGRYRNTLHTLSK